MPSTLYLVGYATAQSTEEAFHAISWGICNCTEFSGKVT